MVQNYYYLLLILLLSGLACHKDDEEPGLPPITSSGANTFGCLIDGKPWVAGLGPEVLDPTLIKLYMNYDETGVGAFYNNNWSLRSKWVTDSTYESFVMTARKITGTGIVYSDPHSLDISFFSAYDRPFKAYEMDTSLPFQVIITRLDTVRHICSGLFEFYAVSTDLNRTDTLHITRGRFDAGYVPE